VLRGLKTLSDPNLLIGSASSDDAAVYRISDDLALVQTLDFFTPIVDDPYLFGQIAAANSLSDIYAMGGKPITAMNIVAMPTDEISLDTINEILKGGADKVAEAGCALAGGHTVQNPEPLYGLSVTGLVNPHRVISNAGAQPGDHLLLTKPIGTGIVSTAIKKGLASPELIQKVSEHMASLNTQGTAMAEAGLTKAGTDVTGFGLLGHLSHVCRESGVTARIAASQVPVFDPAVIEFIKAGCVPGGSRKNLELAEEFTLFGNSVPDELKILLADAQTSGGLLLAVSPEHYQEAQDLLFAKGSAIVADIGVVTHQDEHPVVVS
jgi:selenide,water dikinase|tara:strand:+ start:19211 stop:20176 length:966 start_codon:yes stop_codon:yes gene_type:complete